MKIIRIILASIFFILIVLSFVFSSTNSLPFLKLPLIQLGPAIIRLLAAFSLTTLIIILLILILTFIFGRFYCAIICPLGILQDIFTFNVKKTRISSSKKTRYIIASFTFVTLLVGNNFLLYLLDPFSIFGRIDTIILNSGITRLINLIFPAFFIIKDFSTTALVFGILTFIIIISLSILKRRTFCVSICPIGTLLGLISKYSIFKIKIDFTKCTKCQICAHSCPTGCIDIKNTTINSETCINCFNCLKCPKDAISFKRCTTPKTMVDQNRRRFLLKTVPLVATGGIVSKYLVRTTNKILPPGAISTTRFMSKCTSCGLCVTNCPSKVLALNSYPSMDFNRGFCEFDCFTCTKICPTGAITNTGLLKKQRIRIGLAQLTLSKCVTITNGTACGACAEQCPTGALQMVDNPLGPVPEFNQDLCIGCGACQNACPVLPVRAIIVRGLDIHEESQDPIEYFRKKRAESGLDASASSDEWLF